MTLAICYLQNELPNARIVYICATGVSEPRIMSYMNRLGLWGRGTSFKGNFIVHLMQYIKINVSFLQYLDF